MIDSMFKKEDSVFYLDDNIIQYRDRLDKCNALIQGEDYVKKGEKKYFKMNSSDEEQQYQHKLKMAHLTNAFKMVITQQSSKLINSEISIDETPEIEALKDKADIDNNNLQVFLGKVFDNAVGLGCSAVMVDYPNIQNKNALTRYDLEGTRPYLRIINPYYDILGYDIDNENNLLEIRILISKYEKVNGYKKDNKYYVKKYFINDQGKVSMEYYTYDDNQNDVLLDVIDSDFNEIPIIPIVLGDDDDLFLSKLSPIQGLADLNIALYQLETEIKGLLSLSMNPILLGTGGAIVDESKNIIDYDTNLSNDNSNITYKPIFNGWDYISQNKSKLKGSTATVVSTDRNKNEVDLKFVQPSTAPVTSAFEELSNIKSSMRVYGIDLEIQNHNQLATTKIIDNETINNTVKGFISEVENLLYKVLNIYMDYWNKSYDGKVSIDYGFGEKPLTGEQKELIKMLFDKGELSSEIIYTYILKPRFPALENITWEDITESLNTTTALPTTTQSVTSQLQGIFNQ